MRVGSTSIISITGESGSDIVGDMGPLPHGDAGQLAVLEADISKKQGPIRWDSENENSN